MITRPAVPRHVSGSRPAAAALILLLMGVGTCRQDTYGEGIGRPPHQASESEPVLPVAIVKIYLADLDPAAHYAKLQHTGQGAAISLDGSLLCDSVDCMKLSGTLLPGEYLRVDVASLALSATAGDLAWVDSRGSMQAYLAWGADPATLDSTLTAPAVLRGLALPGEYVPVPFPMPVGVAVVRDDHGAGCADPVITAQEVDLARCPQVPPAMELTEILPASDAAADTWVEIHNLLAEQVGLYGVRICQLPGCVRLGRDTMIAGRGTSCEITPPDQPCDRLLVHFGAAGTSDPRHVYAPAARSIRLAGELAILRPGNADLNRPDDLLAFVRYGQASGSMAASAALAGLWPNATDAALAPRVSGESLSLDLSGQLLPEAWNPTLTTPLAPNPDIRPDNQEWTACSYAKPGPSGRTPPAAIAIRLVSNAVPATLTVHNRSSERLDLPVDSYLLALGAAEFSLEDDTGLPGEWRELRYGEQLVVELDPEQDGCGAEHLCWQDAAAVLPENGEVTLLQVDSETHDRRVRQHVQWGQAARVNAVFAVAAGVWPLERCSLPPLGAGEDLELVAGTDGHSPPDYR